MHENLPIDEKCQKLPPEFVESASLMHALTVQEAQGKFFLEGLEQCRDMMKEVGEASRKKLPLGRLEELYQGIDAQGCLNYVEKWKTNCQECYKTWRANLDTDQKLSCEQQYPKDCEINVAIAPLHGLVWINSIWRVRNA